MLSATLKTLTSLNKEVRPFFLSDNRIWHFPLFLPLAIAAFGGPEGYFRLAVIGFGAFGFIVPKYYYRSVKMDKSSLASLILRRLRSSRYNSGKYYTIATTSITDRKFFSANYFLQSATGQLPR